MRETLKEALTTKVKGPKVIVASSQAKAALWRFSLTRPGAEWTKPGFDDASWESGRFGIGYAPDEWRALKEAAAA